MVKKTVAEKIAEVVKKTGLTQQQFCKQVGIGESVISRWLKGNRNPSIKSLKIIADATNTPLEYFLDIDPVPVITQNYGIIGNNNKNNIINQMSQDIELLKEKIKRLEAQIETINLKLEKK